MRRKIELATGEYYHIYNRGVDKREIFSCDEDYLRFLKSLKEFNTSEPIGSLYEKHLREKKMINGKGNGSSTPIMGVELPFPQHLVDIICYCLNPNHYHLILKQLRDNGIAKFMQRLGTGYTNYYNKKYSRSGSLFQGKFKSVHVDTNEYFLYLSAYVNMNHFIHGFESELNSDCIESPWKYSSLPDYLGKRSGTLCNKAPILDQFRDANDYRGFLIDNGLYLKEKKEMEKYILE